MYICESYYAPARRDTTRHDSLKTTTEEIILDENGNPVSQPVKREKEETETSNTPKPVGTEPKQDKKEKKKSRPTEQQVNFDDL